MPYYFKCSQHSKGVRILTNPLQEMLRNCLAENVNPFQNTSNNSTAPPFDNNIHSILTSEERAKIAGGFGATDESIIELLMNATLHCSDANHDSISLSMKDL